MKEGGLVLKASDERRIEVLIRVEAGFLSATEAAGLLGVGDRQARRLLAAYRAEGPRGVVHGNRGRRPAHALPEELRDQVRALATGRYAGVNHTHMAQLLAEQEGIQIPRSTLADILREVGVRSPRPQKRRSRHRSRRERYPQEGMLLQIDASLHRWFGPDLPHATLLGGIDDATGKIVALRFEATEDARGYLLLLREVCRKAGVPQAIYSDKHSVFWPTRSETLQEQLAGRRSPTQFGRAMAELGVQLIAAHSPQAKGRVERLWGTLQDRLVAELRLAGVTTIEGANAFLPAFLARFNRRFAVAAKEPHVAYGPRLSAAEANAALCFKHERVVARDNVVRLDQVVFQLLPGPNRLGYAKATVTIHESLDHRFSVHYDGRQLPAKLLPLRKLLTPKPTPRRLPPPAKTPPPTALPWKPPADHPWRSSAPRTKSLGT